MKLFSRVIAFAILSTIIVSGCGSSIKKSGATNKAIPQTIEEATSSQFRTEENKKRDEYRHPLQTLTFFGLEPQMTVVEIWPSAGWYTEIIAPLLSQKGHYIAAVNRSGSGENAGLN